MLDTDYLREMSLVSYVCFIPLEARWQRTVKGLRAEAALRC